MVEDYKEKNESLWNEILNVEKILSDDEAEGIEALVVKLRKERGFGGYRALAPVLYLT